MKDRTSVVFAAGLLLLTVLACGELRKKNAVRESTPDFEITVDQLAKEFKENPTAADMKYTGRTLAITGRVDGKVLGSSLVFEGHARHGFATQCFFDKNDTDTHKKIVKGKDVTVLGVCMGRDSNDGPLMITQCILR
jgi:hypothetical protein